MSIEVLFAILERGLQRRAACEKRFEQVVEPREGGFYETQNGKHVGPVRKFAAKSFPWRCRGEGFTQDAFKRELTPAEAAAVPQPNEVERHQDAMRIAIWLLIQGISDMTLQGRKIPEAFTAAGDELHDELELSCDDYRNSKD